jgi:hypothetical protein
MKKYISIFVLSLVCGLFTACEDQNLSESLEIQQPYKYSELYYQNLRDYKKSNHSISFGWFADYTQHHSLAIRFMGLPDSLDICSLWGGVPTLRKNDPIAFCDTIAYREMCHVREIKGTRFVYVTFPKINDTKFMELPENERVKAYGDHLLKVVEDNDLDGMDLDYEIHGDWMHGAHFVELVEYLGQYIGPKGKNPEKLLIVDGWPIDGAYEYLSYFIAQAYQSPGASDLQNRYNQVAAKGLEPARFIVTENLGSYWTNGGVGFTDAVGNTESFFGGKLYSLEGMARWNPTQGRKGGFGAFYIHRDYNLTPPYRNYRRAIQVQNPAIY